MNKNVICNKNNFWVGSFKEIKNENQNMNKFGAAHP
jgi:hypothetical protein